MCTHGRFVTNKYTGVVFWSVCGKCEACKQQKAAARSSRIRSEYSPDKNVFFVELDYNRFSVPYFTQADFNKIIRDDFNKVFVLPIYRDQKIRWNINTQSYVHSFKPTLLYKHVIPDNDFQYDKDMQFCRWASKSPGKIGVPYFKDIQDFQKRFRQFLIRKLHYEDKVRFFNVNELGPTTQRPHFHFLLFAKGLTEAQVREAIIATWPFSDRARHEKIALLRNPQRKSKIVQLVTDDPAGYVSSYVNCDTSVSSFLARYFDCSKHSASKHFGHGRKSFALEEISKAVDKGSLIYTIERTRNGVPEIVDLPIPKYVINRYFPLFKGYSRFTDPQIREFLSNGFDVGYLLRESVRYDSRSNFPINLTCDKHVNVSDTLDVMRIRLVRGDLSKIRTRLVHAFEYFRSVYPLSSYSDFADQFIRTWNLYKSNSYQRFVNDDTVSDFYKYDNIALYPPDRQRELHMTLDPNCVFIVDNNLKPHYINQTVKMKDMYYKYDKQKKVTDSVRDYNDMYS